MKSIKSVLFKVPTLMFLIFFLLSVNYSILRSVRNTIAVVGLGTGSHNIPIFEFFGVLPGAILMTWVIGLMLHRYSFKTVFLVVQGTFLLFFVLFAGPFYSFLLGIKGTGQLGDAVVFFSSMLFQVMAELWKPGLASILFWGLVNHYIPKDDAKKMYAPLMLGGSLGAVAAGPLISFCTSKMLLSAIFSAPNEWQFSLLMLMSVIFVFGLITSYLYIKLSELFTSQSPVETVDQVYSTSSLWSNITTCFRHPQLRILSWISIVDYIAYSLGEVIFLEVLKYRYPAPTDYCNHMGTLSLFGGVLTVAISLFLAPYLLQKCRWVITALITPVCFLISQGCFFTLLRGQGASESFFGWSEAEWIAVVAFSGSIQYCVCRATKMALLDSSKELALVLMPNEEKMRGKLIIDGLCGRVGRGSAAVLSMAFISIAGGTLASAPLAGVAALGMGASWLMSTFRLGRLIEEKALTQSNALN